jgi:glycosyltransferase involved in cell wall biosynthesis
LPLITFVGRLVAIKGADHVLRACQQLGIDHRVAIAGDGPDRAALMDLAAELGFADRVDFLGALGSDELEALRRRSAVVVVPALSPEVFGMVGPEALAIGVPVVAYEVGGTVQWLQEAGPLAHGVTVGDVEGLARRLRDVLRQRPGEADRQAVARSVRETLSPKRHASRVIDVCREAQEEFLRGRASASSRGLLSGRNRGG